MSLARRLLPLGLLALCAAPLSAAPTKQTVEQTKVGKTNVQVRIVLHPQVDACAPERARELRRKAIELAQAHIRRNLPGLIKKAGTDASGPNQFFGVDYLAGCLKDGSGWIAFPVEGKDKQVTRFAPGLGWSPMMKL